MLIDIEENERRELLALMGRDELPTPDDATRAALLVAGARLGPTAPGCHLVDAVLPPGWTKSPAEVPRAFWILDAARARRFRVWWKAPHTFALEPGYGGVSVAKQTDGLARSWSADDSFEVIAEHKRLFRIECTKCRKRCDFWLSLLVERDDPQARARVEQMAEHAFAKGHATCAAGVLPGGEG